MDALLEFTNSWPQPYEEYGALVIPTHHLYPTGSVVEIHVRSGKSEFAVDDGGHALSEFVSSGIEIPNSVAALQSFAKRRGYRVSPNGAIYADSLTEDLGTHVVTLATVSREACETLYAKYKIRPTRDIKTKLGQALAARFSPSSIAKDRQVVGRSNKPQRFEYSVTIPGGKTLLVDPVLNDPASINSRLVAHMDVSRTDGTFEQGIVYDKDELWKAADLALLGIGARTVEMGSFDSYISRLQAA